MAGAMHSLRPEAPACPNLAGYNKERPSWSPYDDNGGTAVAVAGDDYCVVAASTRLSTGYSILTRHATKVVKLSNKTLVVTAGMQADMVTLHKVLQYRNVTYQFNHRKPLSIHALGQLLANTLYYKRFFPYYTFNLAVGLDDEGKGAVYTYDAVGSGEMVGYSCQGSGRDLMSSVLDNQLKAANPLVLPPKNWKTSLPLDQAVDLVKSCFVAAGERDIYTGDEVEIYIITKDGIKQDTLQLKKD